MGKKLFSLKESSILAVNSLTSDGYYGVSNEEIVSRYLLEFNTFPNTIVKDFKIDIDKVYHDNIAKQLCVHFHDENINDLLLKDTKKKFLIQFNSHGGNNPKDRKFKMLICFPVKAKLDDVKTYIKKLTEPYLVADKKTESTVHFITSTNGNYDLQEYEFTKPVIDLELNYGENFSEIHNKILSILNEKKSGLFLFHSVPGTGKSKYIQYLTDAVEKKFIYLNSELFSVFDSPQFTSFALSELKDTVLILEDCENIITSREINKNNSIIPTLLNLTSGIFADVLNCKIICTFNTSANNLDDALIRKGRLLLEHQFRMLTAAEANKLYKQLNNSTDEPFDKEVTLSEVYNIEEVTSTFKKEKRKIGF